MSPTPADTPPVVEGDCLARLTDALALLGGPPELVYLDPPFGAGGTRRARGARGARAEGEAAYGDAWGGVDQLLTMLEPRLGALRDALSAEGSLWLHLDHRAVHDAKGLADRVFGRRRFRGEIVWVPGNGARGKSLPVTHQTILVYSRGPELVWNATDPALREPHAKTSLAMHFQQVDGAGRAYREREIGGRRYRYYADQGRARGSVWDDCPAMVANSPLGAETTGYPTQKPLALLDRIVRAATRPGARVLDPMCGSGTTLVAARAAGRVAAGIDTSPLACRIARARLGAALPGPGR